MVGAGADLIALDEPTNHLDFDTLEVIEAALRAYRGTLVIATHDRALLDAVGCDRIVEVRDGGRVTLNRYRAAMTAFRYAIAPAMGLLLAVPATSQATRGRLRRDDHFGHQAARRPDQLPGLTGW